MRRLRCFVVVETTKTRVITTRDHGIRALSIREATGNINHDCAKLNAVSVQYRICIS